MMHEVLFCLWNFPGDFFNTESEEEWKPTVEMKEFFHPGEQKLLDRILSVAASHRQVAEFIINVRNIPTRATPKDCANAAGIQPGLYVKAFCEGLDDALETYRSEIVALEQTLLQNPALQLTYVLACVERYSPLFEAFVGMIRLIRHEQVHGCLLMGKLHGYANSGYEIVAEAAKTVIKAVNFVFFRQLCGWVIYGKVEDTYGEFFIRDANCADENFLYPDQGTRQSANDSNNFSNAFKSRGVKRPPPIQKFTIVKPMVPVHISLETAETILFVGCMVWIVKNDPRQFAGSSGDSRLAFRADVWDGEAAAYYRRLKRLEDEPFNSASFDRAIEECRLKLTKYLWNVIVEEAQLVNNLQLIRDYFALGRGELFQQFILRAEEHLTANASDYVVHSLNSIFAETARTMYGENNATYSKFELSLRSIHDGNSEANPWARVEINFDIAWPLHVLFHPKAMSLYNKLFGFLLRVKKSQIDLTNLWSSHMETKSSIEPSLWTLRNNLLFIVNTLQYYLQVDVIEAQFSILKRAICAADEFEDVIRLHSVFLKNLLTQTFVLSVDDKKEPCEFKCTLYQLPPVNFEGTNTVHKVLMKILRLCDDFCASASMWRAGELAQHQRDELATLRLRHSDLVEVLLRLLYSLHERSAGHHLLQLLNHIDFNGWYSKVKADCL